MLHPIYTFPVFAIFLPVICRLINRKQTWVSIICALFLDLVLYWDAFCYIGTRGTMMSFALVQVAVMSVLSFLLTLLRRR